jgi:glycerol-1-phosphate dehydrogenase [NAD(P)+]
VEPNIRIYVGRGAISRLIQYCENQGLDRFMLIADDNTYRALGQTVESAFKDRGLDVRSVILTGDEIIADEHYVMQVFLRADERERVYLAVGSGTITDITRFVSHRQRTSFISVSTAPSVDGFTSPSAPMVIGRLKQTIPAQPPIAVFGDLATLRQAPRPLIASGFGDMLGKYTSQADWRLGHLLWGEPYSEDVARRTWDALQVCVHHASEIGSALEGGIRGLMEGLLESGMCMLEFGNSRPAAGAEHYLSHYLEMKLLRENRPAILHGAKVGVACLLVAAYYEKVRQLTRQQVAERLGKSRLPDRGLEVQRIREGYGPAVAEKVIVEQQPFLEMSEDSFARLKQRILDRWGDILDIATSVPKPEVLADLLRKVGGPTDARMLGLEEEEIALGLEYSHYLRNRFTVMKLCRIIGLK